MEFGLNMYSIRHRMKTEGDFLAACHELREMGYSYIQFSGAPFDAPMIQRVSEASRLPVPLTHVPLTRILQDTDRLFEEHLMFGCKYIGLGAMTPLSLFFDLPKCHEAIDALETAAARLAQKGGKLFYHNHALEFIKHGNTTVLDYLIEKAPHVHFTLDVYWAQVGGADVCSLIDRLAGRVECIHLKDYQITVPDPENIRYEPVFAPVGDGNMDFPKLIKHARAAGTEYFFVEQDNASLLPDSMEQVAKSARYLREIE